MLHSIKAAAPLTEERPPQGMDKDGNPQRTPTRKCDVCSGEMKYLASLPESAESRPNVFSGVIAATTSHLSGNRPSQLVACYADYLLVACWHET